MRLVGAAVFCECKDRLMLTNSFAILNVTLFVCVFLLYLYKWKRLYDSNPLLFDPLTFFMQPCFGEFLPVRRPGMFRRRGRLFSVSSA